ncbi:MAG: DUF2974 domain-containing protein [Erysipelotrichaceae bacterium]|nr:DUF2974 domain-containing protein [Erysipelotrichaceae bacterium]
MNMNDYIKWRGDLSFLNSPFNAIDGLIMAYLSYIDFDKCLSDKGSTVKEAADKYFEIHGLDILESPIEFVRSSSTCLKEMAESERFKDCLIYNYVNIFHTDIAEQFSAICVDVPYSPTVIAFRGTDDTIIGWKEDLILSYGDIASQDDAIAYLEENVKWFKKYRVVGHSKGGFLAQYSVAYAKPEISKRVVQYISYDGPGLPNKAFRELDEDIRHKFLKVVPHSDIVGTIYPNECKQIIVKSSAAAMAAHSGFTWEVEGTRFITVEEPSIESRLITEAFDSFINDTTVEQRELFVDQFFAKIDEANVTTVSEFINGGLHVFYKVLKSVMEMEEGSKEVASIFMRKISQLINEEVSEKIEATREGVIEAAQHLTDQAKEILKIKK